MRVIEVNEIERLLSYRDDWGRLLRETSDACFFQTLEWLTIYWRHFGNDQRLRILFVYDGDRLVGILPLAVRLASTRGGALRTLGYPLDSWGTRYSPLGKDLHGILSAGLMHVQTTARDWDVLELDWTSADLQDEVTAAFGDVGVRPQISCRDEVSVLDLTQSWDDYWKSRHGKHRNNVRRAEKKVAALGTVTTTHHRTDGSAVDWELYETCERISGTSWQGALAIGTALTHERVREFLRDVHDVASRLGAVAIHALSVDGEPAAFSYNYVYGGAEFGLRMGYDPKFKSAGPGTVLLHRMLKDAFSRDLTRLDFGEGDSDYKHAWRTDVMRSYRFCHYATTSLRAQALRWKRHWWGEASEVTPARAR